MKALLLFSFIYYLCGKEVNLMYDAYFKFNNLRDQKEFEKMVKRDGYDYEAHHNTGNLTILDITDNAVSELINEAQKKGINIDTLENM